MSNMDISSETSNTSTLYMNMKRREEPLAGTTTNGFYTTTGYNSTESNMTPTACSNEYCLSHEEYYDMVWDYIFPAPWEWVLIGFYFVVFIIGVVGNFLVCFAVFKNPSMRTVTNYFIVNLAVADLLVITICLPPTVLDDVTETWYMGGIMCRVVKYLQACAVSVSVLTLTCISVERWYAICYPLKFKATRERAKLMIVFIWFVSLCIVVPELVVLDTHPKFPTTVLLTSCRPTWSSLSQTVYQFALSIAMFLLPFILMFVMYYQIARCLWSNVIPTETSRDHLHPSSDGRSCSDSQIQSRRKVAKMLMAVVFMFGFCYSSVHLLNILRYAGILKKIEKTNIPTYMALIAHWLCYFNSAINPVIYNFMSTKFRKEFREACFCLHEKKVIQPAHRRDNYTYRYTNSFEPKNRMFDKCEATSMTHC